MMMNAVSRRPAMRCFAPHNSLSGYRSLCRRRTVVQPQANLFTQLFGGDKSVAENKDAATQKKAPAVVFNKSSNTQNPEFPPYSVVKRGPVYDLRLYEVYPVVEMLYDKREEGYGALGAYIDGVNDEETKFAYSQPVIMRYYSSGNKAMQMYLGTRQLKDGTVVPRTKATAETLSSLPAPKGPPGVSVNVAGGELVAIFRFEGYITPLNADKAKKELLAALKSDGIQLADDEAGGFFRCAQYGAVYQLAGRLNEMMLRVKA